MDPPARNPGEGLADRHAVLSEVGAYCERLPGLINFWLDARLRGKLSVAEVAEEVRTVINDYFDRFGVSVGVPIPYLARGLALRTLERIHREYLGMRCNRSGRAAVLRLPDLPRASPRKLARRLWRRVSGPSGVRCRDPVELQRAFNELPMKDRLILAMRHFERLSNKEIAQILGIAESTASHRYWQAMQKLLPKKVDISA